MNKKRDEARSKMNALYSQPRTMPKAEDKAENTKRTNPLSLMQDALTMMSPDNTTVNQDNVIVTLNPSKILPSFVEDRISIEDDQEFDTLKDSIKESGQQIPILVRPHPENKEHYQIAFGHRRWRACQALDIPVRAIVKNLSDDDLVVAQGTENSERKDLSFIEQALFAYELQNRGFTRDVISAALGRKGKKSEQYISMLTSIPKAVPENVIRKIGAAPKIGRPRWEQFVNLYTSENQKIDVISKLLNSEEWQKLNSDTRFSKMLALLSQVNAVPKTKPSPVKLTKSAEMTNKGKRIEITFDKTVSPELEAHIKQHLVEALNSYNEM